MKVPYGRASFQAQPATLSLTVGNTEILEGLNTALRYILGVHAQPFADQAYFANFPDLEAGGTFTVKRQRAALH